MSDSVDAQTHTILVIDDNPANLSVVTDYLAGHGFQIMVARAGEAGLRLAQQNRPDLILLDVQLPGIDGFEVCRRLKADERTQEIPVIFMTVAAKTEDKVRGFEAGGVDYITKPFQHEEVLARVTTHLCLRHLTRELEEAKEGLERRVVERTAELAQANVRLKKEIAERKQAEEELRESERLLAEIAANYPNSYVAIIEKDLTIGFASGQEFKKRNLNPKNLEGLSLEQVFGDHAPTVKKHYLKTFQGQEASFELFIDNQYQLYKVVPLYDQAGQVTRILTVAENITKRKRAEAEIRRLNQELEQRVFDRTAQLEAANKELEAFAYSVSHDLRAPLRHIDGFLELLQQRMVGTLDEHSRHYMDTIADAATRMGQLIDDLLTFSRMGRDELVKMPVDLGTLVQEVIEELAPEMHDRSIHWHIADLPTVSGDRTMLRQVMVNLLSNALKFTRERTSVEIEIGCQADEREAIIFIRDNGVGFDMAYADKLFGVFQRLHRVEEFEGTGIGLANVRRIISRHGGRTWAEGKVDQGATFYFSLPQPIQQATITKEEP